MAAPVAERRLVSVLFCDLVGFTGLSEDRDPEAVRELLGRYFELCREVIGRYGGTVEKFIGDAVMAVWGAPVAHEDDAERAVRAGLELVDAVRALGPTIMARAGVLTGEAAVTLGAVNQGMVAGDLVNTASRIQGAAATGTVLVGEATMQAASRAIAFEPAGEQALKGKAAPVAAWRAIRVVAERGGRNRAEGLEAPFVGRDDELRLLKDWFHGAGRDRRLRTVSVTGQAGIGKSRLAWEFEKYLDGLVEPVFWHHGRSPSIGSALPFWALAEMVRGRFRLAETDDDAITRARITADLPQWIADVEERRWVEAALLALLGVDGSESGSRLGHEQLFGAWRTLLERIAAQGPVVLVFEDLHWADDGLLAFVDHLVEWSRSAPILLVSLARPELLDRRSDWGSGRRHFMNLPLEPLPDAAMRELLAGLVPGLPATAATAIVERADGVPLYAVETVRMLVAEGRLAAQPDGTYQPVGDLSALAVPATLQSLIAARLDALDPADRTLLQAVSVLGQSFTAESLGAVLPDLPAQDARLAALVRRELLVHDRDPRSPERGQYAFVQALLREVAYSTLARPDRRRLHLAAARYFEGLGEEGAPGALAAQYLAAWTASAGGPEADALAGQARIALRSAAESAAALGYMEQAVALLRQALDVTADDDERATIMERAGDLAAVAGLTDVAEELLLAVQAVFVARGDRSAEARVIARRANVLSASNSREAALALTTEALERLGDLGDDPGLVDLLAQHGRFLYLLDRRPEAVLVVDRVLPVAERLDMLPVVAELLVTRGTALASIGREYEGIAVLDGGLRLAAAHGLTATELRARINLSGFLNMYDPREGYATAAAGAEMAMRLGLKAYAPSLVGNMASNALETGHWDQSIAQLWQAIETAGVTADATLQFEYHLVELGLWRGDNDPAMTARVHDHLARRIAAGDSSFVPTLHYHEGIAAQAAGRHAEAYEHCMMSAPQDAFNAPAVYAWAIELAITLADAPRLQAAMHALRGTGSHAPLSRIALRFGDAAAAALDARRNEALAGIREVLGALEALGCVWRRAGFAFAAGALLGPADPEGRRLLDGARGSFERQGARPFVEQVDALLASGTPLPRPAAPSGAAPHAARVPD